MIYERNKLVPTEKETLQNAFSNLNIAYSGADSKLTNIMSHVSDLENKIKLDLLLTTSDNT